MKTKSQGMYLKASALYNQAKKLRGCSPAAKRKLAAANRLNLAAADRAEAHGSPTAAIMRLGRLIDRGLRRCRMPLR